MRGSVSKILEEEDDLFSNLINDKAVCKRAQATTGLLITLDLCAKTVPVVENADLWFV